MSDLGVESVLSSLRHPNLTVTHVIDESMDEPSFYSVRIHTSTHFLTAKALSNIRELPLQPSQSYIIFISSLP